MSKTRILRNSDRPYGAHAGGYCDGCFRIA